MISLQILIFVISFLLTLVLVPLNIKLSRKYGFVDVPSQRSVHDKSIPSAGGLSFAIVIIIFEILLVYLFHLLTKKFLALAIVGFFITILGLYDDKKNASPFQKLTVEIILILVLYFAGFKINKITNPFGSNELSLGIFSLPLTLIWFLVVINAINIIDGLDGLAVGIVFFTALVLIILGNLKGFFNLSLISLVIAGSLLAFLKYNFYPAKIFMGDTGSLLLGINIAAISIIGIGEFKRFTVMTMLIPISALIIPLSDFIFAIVRRIKNGKSILLADKNHLHHMLLNFGLSQKFIAIISYFITFVFGLIAIGFSFAPKNVHFIILIVLFLIILLAYYVIYKESKK